MRMCVQYEYAIVVVWWSALEESSGLREALVVGGPLG